MWRRYGALVTSCVIAMVAIGLLLASRSTRVYATENGGRVDCGTWEHREIEVACFDKFDMIQLAQLVLPITAAIATCAAVLQLTRLGRPRRVIGDGEVVRLREVGQRDAKRFTDTIDARAVTANHWAEGEVARMRRFCRRFGLPLHAAVCDLITGRIVGGVSLHPDTSGKPFSAEVGIWIAEEWSGRGYGTDAIRVFTQSLQRRGFSPITAETDVANSGMRALLERCSFAAVGEHEREMPNGTTLAVVRYQHVDSEPDQVPPGYIAANVAPPTR
jgi:RimJ/RimL family protein N-acetyltransferase